VKVLEHRQPLNQPVINMMDYAWYSDGASAPVDPAGKCLNFVTSYNDG